MRRLREKMESNEGNALAILKGVFIDSVMFTASRADQSDEWIGSVMRSAFSGLRDNLSRVDRLTVCLDQLIEKLYSFKNEAGEHYVIDDECYIHAKSIIGNSRKMFAVKYAEVKAGNGGGV
jgi:hypothetical protein